MTFALLPGQFADLSYVPLAGSNLGGHRYDIIPTVPIPNFQLQIPDTAFPTPFQNPAPNLQNFEIDGYLKVPDNWTPHGWQKMIYRKDTQISSDVYLYSWGTSANPTLWKLTVSIRPMKSLDISIEDLIQRR
jgi:hypothetical protein